MRGILELSLHKHQRATSSAAEGLVLAHGWGLSDMIRIGVMNGGRQKISMAARTWLISTGASFGLAEEDQLQSLMYSVRRLQSAALPFCRPHACNVSSYCDTLIEAVSRMPPVHSHGQALGFISRVRNVRPMKA